MNVRRLIVLSAALPERAHRDLSALCLAWVRPWDPEDLGLLVTDFDALLAQGNLMLRRAQGRATAEAAEIHKQLRLADPTWSRELMPGAYSVEELQVAVSSRRGDALMQELVTAGMPRGAAEEQVLAALEAIEALDLALAKFVRSALEDLDVPVDSAAFHALSLKGASVAEVLGSAYLSTNRSELQLRVRRFSAALFSEAMADLEGMPYAHAQQFLNGLETI